MALPIPRDAVQGIVNIIKLSEASVDEITTVLTKSPISLEFDEMLNRLLSEVSTVSSDQMSNILNALYSLYQMREFSGVMSSRFIDDLIDGISEIHDELDIHDTDVISFKSRFEKLLSINTLYIIAKSTRLQYDGERLYFEAKILSDIRPVFDSDPTNMPSAAVITHTLKIIYHEGNNHREFHIILNYNDLDSLSKTINRAMMKDETLRNLLKQANLSDLGG